MTAFTTFDTTESSISTNTNVSTNNTIDLSVPSPPIPPIIEDLLNAPVNDSDFSFFDGPQTKDEKLARSARLPKDASSLFLNMITASTTGDFKYDKSAIYWTAQPAIKNVFGISPAIKLLHCADSPDNATKKYNDDNENKFKNYCCIVFPISDLLYKISCIGGNTTVAPNTELNGILHPIDRVYKYPTIQDIANFVRTYVQLINLNTENIDLAVSIGDGEFYYVPPETNTATDNDKNIDELNSDLFKMYYTTIPNMDKNQWDLLANVSPYNCELQKINFPHNQVVIKGIVKTTINNEPREHDITIVMQFAYEDVLPLLSVNIYNRK